MPKGLLDHVWYQRSKLGFYVPFNSQSLVSKNTRFCSRKVYFGHGQAPPKDSHWGRLLARIKICPASGGTLDDALGQRVVYYYGHHVVIFIFLLEFRIQLFHKL